MPTGRNLPADVISQIIDHLSNDKASLKACCLTHRSWIYEARKHLYREAIVDSDSDFCPSPEMAQHVRDLEVCGLESVSKEGAAWENIARFSRVEYLSLSCLRWTSTSPREQAALKSIFPRVTRLTIEIAGFRYIWDLLILISAFPEITDLVLQDIFLEDQMTAVEGQAFLEEHRSLINLPGKNLRLLSFLEDSYQDAIDLPLVRGLMDHWLAVIPAGSLQEFALTWQNSEAIAALPDLFRLLGPSLKHLEMDIRYGDQATRLGSLGIHHCTKLCTVIFRRVCMDPSVTNHIYDGDCSWVTPMLSEIRSPDLQRVEFSCVPEDQDDMGQFDFALIDRILAGPRFQKLTAITISLPSASISAIDEEQLADLRDFVWSALPMAKEKGILQVIEHNDKVPFC